MAKPPFPHDPAIGGIAAAGHKLSFTWLRAQYGKDHHRKDELDFGHAVLPSVELLDQYLWTYGRMIPDQWRHAAALLPAIREPIRWIDYGCGQGVAGLLIRDHARTDPFPNVREVVLIDPSALALRRATALYGALAPAARIRPIAKLFDALRDDDLRQEGNLPTVHILSNSLDLPGFDHYALLDRMLTPGRHTILAVSHDRNFRGGTERFVQWRKALESGKMRRAVTVRTSRFEPFTCDNPSKSSAVAWLAEIDVRG